MNSYQPISSQGLFDAYKQVVLTGETFVAEVQIQEGNVTSEWVRLQAVRGWKTESLLPHRISLIVSALRTVFLQRCIRRVPAGDLRAASRS